MGLLTEKIAYIVCRPMRLCPGSIKNVLLAEEEGKESISKVKVENTLVEVIWMTTVCIGSNGMSQLIMDIGK